MNVEGGGEQGEDSRGESADATEDSRDVLHNDSAAAESDGNKPAQSVVGETERAGVTQCGPERDRDADNRGRDGDSDGMEGIEEEDPRGGEDTREQATCKVIGEAVAQRVEGVDLTGEEDAGAASETVASDHDAGYVSPNTALAQLTAEARHSVDRDAVEVVEVDGDGDDGDHSRMYVDVDANDDLIGCICGRNSEDGFGYLVQCDQCRDWFHQVCLDLPEEQAQLPDVWVCFRCLGKRTPRLKKTRRGEPVVTKLDSPSPRSKRAPTKSRKREVKAKAKTKSDTKKIEEPKEHGKEKSLAEGHRSSRRSKAQRDEDKDSRAAVVEKAKAPKKKSSERTTDDPKGTKRTTRRASSKKASDQLVVEEISTDSGASGTEGVETRAGRKRKREVSSGRSPKRRKTQESTDSSESAEAKATMWPCVVDGCEMAFPSKEATQRHFSRTHGVKDKAKLKNMLQQVKPQTNNSKKERKATTAKPAAEKKGSAEQELVNGRPRMASNFHSRILSALSIGMDYTMADDDPPEDVSQLAWDITDELLLLRKKDSATFRAQYQTISHNVRANDDLRGKILRGEITPQRLCEMSSDEMALREQAEFRARQQEIMLQMHVKKDDPAGKKRFIKTNRGLEEVTDEMQEAETHDGEIAGLLASNAEADTAASLDDDMDVDMDMGHGMDLSHSMSPPGTPPPHSSPSRRAVRSSAAFSASRGSGSPAPSKSENMSSFGTSESTAAFASSPKTRERKINTPRFKQRSDDVVAIPRPASDNVDGGYHEHSSPGRSSRSPTVTPEPFSPPAKSAEDWSPVSRPKSPSAPPFAKSPTAPAAKPAHELLPVVWSGKMGEAEGIESFGVRGHHFYGDTVDSWMTEGATLHFKGKMDAVAFTKYLNELDHSTSTKRAAVLLSPTLPDSPDYNVMFELLASSSRVAVLEEECFKPIVREVYAVPLPAGKGFTSLIRSVSADVLMKLGRTGNRLLIIAVLLKNLPKPVETAIPSATSSSSKERASPHEQSTSPESSTLSPPFDADEHHTSPPTMPPTARGHVREPQPVASASYANVYSPAPARPGPVHHHQEPMQYIRGGARGEPYSNGRAGQGAPVHPGYYYGGEQYGRPPLHGAYDGRPSAPPPGGRAPPGVHPGMRPTGAGSVAYGVPPRGPPTHVGRGGPPAFQPNRGGHAPPAFPHGRGAHASPEEYYRPQPPHRGHHSRGGRRW